MRGMAHEFSTSHLKDSLSLFHYYKQLGERAMAQVPDDGLFAIPDPESNSIAIIVKHLAGNMRSRWTDFLTSDGEKPDRHRDTEFESPPATRAELMALWEAGWKRVFGAIDLARHYAGGNWTSLSIPRGKSAAFNVAVADGKASQR